MLKDEVEMVTVVEEKVLISGCVTNQLPVDHVLQDLDRSFGILNVVDPILDPGHSFVSWKVVLFIYLSK